MDESQPEFLTVKREAKIKDDDTISAFALDI